jgi:hypothetical protein
MCLVFVIFSSPLLVSSAGSQFRDSKIFLPFDVFQKDLYNFGSLYTFIQRICTVFWTVIMQQNTPGFIWDSYGSMRFSLVMQGVSKRALQLYSKCYCLASVKKKVTLVGVQTVHLSRCWTMDWSYAFKRSNTRHTVTFGIQSQSSFLKHPVLWADRSRTKLYKYSMMTISRTVSNAGRLSVSGHLRKYMRTVN